MIKLYRNISVSSFDVQATVAVAKDRPEYLAVVELAAALQRPIASSDVCRELFAGLPAQVGWRVIERCIGLGLLERPEPRGAAILSDLGRSTLALGEVLVPQEGTWRFYLAEDPLFEQRVVHVQRLPQDDNKAARDARKDLKATRNEVGTPSATPQACPTLLTHADAHSQPTHSILDGHAFKILALSAKGRAGPRMTVRLGLTWGPGERPQVRVRGALPTSQAPSGENIDHLFKSVSALAGVEYDDFWAALVEGQTGVSSSDLLAWRDLAERLVLPTESAVLESDAQRRRFSRSLALRDLNFETIGRFEDSQIAHVDVVPHSDEAAQTWAEWLQLDRVDGYRTPELLNRDADQVRQLFEFHQVALPAPEVLLQRAKLAPATPRSIYLLAPADLGLWS